MMNNIMGGVCVSIGDMWGYVRMLGSTLGHGTGKEPGGFLVLCRGLPKFILKKTLHLPN